MARYHVKITVHYRGGRFLHQRVPRWQVGFKTPKSLPWWLDTAVNDTNLKKAYRSEPWKKRGYSPGNKIRVFSVNQLVRVQESGVKKSCAAPSTTLNAIC